MNVIRESIVFGVQTSHPQRKAYVRRRGMKFDELAFASDMRAMGYTYVQIAKAFREKYGFNALVAMRKAHGWSQRTAEEHWSALYPDDPKTFKSFSLWETGTYKPGIRVYEQLAKLYQCSVVDLLEGVGDYRHLDSAKWSTEDYNAGQLPLFDFCEHGCLVIGSVLSPVDGVHRYVNARASLERTLAYCKERIGEAMEAMEQHELTSVRYLWGSTVMEEMKSVVQVLRDQRHN